MKKPRITLVHGRKRGSNMLEVKVYFPEQKVQKYVSVGKLLPDDFDDEDRIVKPTSDLYSEYKAKIKKITYTVIDVWDDLFQKDGYAEATKVMTEYKKHITGKLPSANAIIFFESYVNESNDISSSTASSYKQTIGLVKQFDPKTPFSDLNYNYATRFVRFLHDRYSNANTIKKHYTILKKLVSAASKYGHVSSNDYEEFLNINLRGQDVDRDILLPEDIKKLELVEYNDTIYHDTQQIFLLAFFTSLRINDVLALERADFSEIDGDLILNVFPEKNKRYKRKVTYNLSEIFDGAGANIVKPYLEGKSDYIFQDITYQKIYNPLKEIISELGFKGKIGFHTARRSCLTYIAYKTKSIYKVMNFGGISNAATAEKYVDAAKEMFKVSETEIDW